MTAKKIIKSVLEILGEDASVADGALGTELTLLVRCLNMIIKEIAEEYVEFKATEAVAVTDGFVSYSALSHEVRAIKEMRHDGVRVDFVERTHGVETDATGEVSVTYSYYPADVGVSDELVLPRSVSERALVYGTASEYCLMKEQFEECVNLNSRYVRAISSAARPKREIRIKERAWI